MSQRTTYEAKCSVCNEVAVVPFKPTPGKPVYCKACFAKRLTSSPTRTDLAIILNPNKLGREEDNPKVILQIMLCRRVAIKLIKGWKKISNEGGFVNETTGQTLIISKKEFSQNYNVLLFVGEQTSKKEGRKISPDFHTEVKAETFAMDWMGKHPNGLP